MAQFQGEYERSRVLNQEALALARAIGDSTRQGFILDVLGMDHICLGHVDRGISVFREALALWLDEWAGRRSVSVHNLGVAERTRGAYARAGALFEQSLALAREAQDPRRAARSLEHLGIAALYEGDWDRARRWFVESMAACPPPRSGNLTAIEATAAAAAARGELGRAACLFGAVDRLHDPHYQRWYPKERAFIAQQRAAVHEGLRPRAHARARGRGLLMNIEQATTAALR